MQDVITFKISNSFRLPKKNNQLEYFGEAQTTHELPEEKKILSTIRWEFYDKKVNCLVFIPRPNGISDPITFNLAIDSTELEIDAPTNLDGATVEMSTNTNNQ